ncbi:DUF4806 domain-containing protein [Camponotus japonicus]
MQEQLNRVETELEKMYNIMERILKCVQTKQDRRRAVQKPMCLSISTEQEMYAFETINENIYKEVDYVQYVGGFTVKEAINLSFKEVIKDVTTAFTWFRREQDQTVVQLLYNKPI